MIEKIVSGGQTGADRAALDAAMDCGVDCGGWIPKGRKTEDGFLPEKYKLKEMECDKYQARTKKNVVDSDATLIISHGYLNGGSNYTMIVCNKLGKPVMHIDLNIISENRAVDIICKWILDNSINVLNVAGPRLSKDRKIYNRAYKIICSVIEKKKLV